MSDSALSIGLFYGSTTCYTEMAAEKIQAQLNSLFEEDIVDLHNIKDVNLTRTAEYDIIIFGISTWDFGELQEDWESHWEEVHGLDLSGKTSPLDGDQLGYGEWFQDALGMLTCNMPSTVRSGYWPNEGYSLPPQSVNRDKLSLLACLLTMKTYDKTDAREAGANSYWFDGLTPINFGCQC